MEFEDSRNALFVEPNAYIQKFEKIDKCEPKKVIFSEPYESLPAFYIDNNFKKGHCDCLSKSKPDLHHRKDNHRCDFNKYQHNNQCCNNSENLKNCNSNNPDDKCHNDNSKQNGFGFDLKSLLPLIGLFNKGGGADLGSLVGLLNNNSVGTTNVSNSNPMNLISGILSNKEAMSGIMNLFKGGGLNLFNKKQTAKKELKTTDFEIKNYTRVE